MENINPSFKVFRDKKAMEATAHKIEKACIGEKLDTVLAAAMTTIITEIAIVTEGRKDLAEYAMDNYCAWGKAVLPLLCDKLYPPD